MKRVTLKPRKNWQKRLEDAGCEYHTIGGKPYWNEHAAYEFTAAEIDKIEEAGDELHGMCMELAQDTAKRGDYEGYSFPDEVRGIIEQSWIRERAWNNRDAHLFGRLDLGYDGKSIKLFEYNADTPTALPEAAVWQWHALEDRGWPDQFNSIHEALVERWKDIVDRDITVHFAAHSEGRHEDFGNLHYMLECAQESGFGHCVSMNIEEIGWDEESKYFVDGYPRTIQTLFKLYPWEWMMADEYGWRIKETKTKFIEPPWKMLLSTKAILPLLWKRHPNHPLLLEAHFDKGQALVGNAWVRKPLLGREGANITTNMASRPGPTKVFGEYRPEYDKHGYVYQGWFNQPAFDGRTPVLGVWIIGDKACGMGIREDQGLITTNASQFVPHYFIE